jgi:hypothetical protein
MEKITFKVIHLANQSSPRQLKLLSKEASGKPFWIDSNGADYSINPPSPDHAESLNLNSVETYEVREANGQIVKKKRVFGLFSYLPEQEELKMDVGERQRNLILRKAHLMLKTHMNVAYKDKSGQDINPNRWGATVMFELIEESQNVKNENEYNLKITECRNIAQELFESGGVPFIDFCYAYGMTNIKNTPPEVLFNEINQKIIINPDHFLKVYEEKENQVKILLRKSIEHLKEDNTTLISLMNGVYTLNGEILGDSEDKAIYHLNSHPKLKEYLQTMLGITPEYSVPEVPTLSPVSDHPVQSDAKKLFEKGLDEQAVKAMKTKVNSMFNSFQTKSQKEPSKKGELLEKLKQDLEEKKSFYVEILPYFESHVELQWKYVNK